MRIIYRRVVKEINGDNYMLYFDVKNFNQKSATGEFTNFPVYIDKITDKAEDISVSRFNFHEHFQRRTPSLYEDQIIFGATGFSLLLNFLQSIGFIFIAWSILLFVKHFDDIVSHYGNISLVVLIPSFAFYLIAYGYLISISLRWYTVISSVII